jgi:lipoprotein-anchoring transpeptidase ErfK/SrfK
VPPVTRVRVVSALICCALAAGAPAAPALAEDRNEFGPPWVGQVVAERAALRKEPDGGSTVTGELKRGTLVPVLAAAPGPGAAATWFGTPSGFVAASDLREERPPVLGRITRDAVPVRGSPNGGAAVVRELTSGDLVRLTGLSPGIDGDKGAWWATTDGWVPLDAVEHSPAEAAGQYTLPKPEEAPRGWWGETSDSANVRAAPTRDAPAIGLLGAGARVKVLSEEQGEPVDGDATWYRIDGGKYAGGRIHRSLVTRIADPRPNTTRPDPAPDDGTWLVVDRATSTLTLVEKGQPTLTTYASLGNSLKNTPTGRYATIGKYRYQDMSSASVPDASHSYDMPNVPFAAHFRAGGYAIHGAYWHDDFGRPHSDGCVNLTITDAAFVFERTRPEIAGDENSRWTDPPYATPVLIVG